MKNINPLKPLFLSLLFACFANFVSAQDNAWTTVKSYPKADIQSSTLQCTVEGITTEYEVFRIVNKTNAQIRVKFDMQYFNGAQCTTCNNNEYKNILFYVPANGSIEGGCASGSTAERLKAYKQTMGLINQTIPAETLRFENVSIQ